MNINEQVKLDNYFSNREVDPAYYSSYNIPRYLRPYLPKNKDARILDIGCGYGQFLSKLQELNYSSLKGIDINTEAITECRKKGLDVTEIKDIRDFAKTSTEKYDFIMMSHVLEHIEKDLIIDTLIHIKEHLLKPNGQFSLMVPNAQSYTGTYWRYEDFTHTILFTAGSCIYVLKAAGFKSINFIDADGTEQMTPLKKIVIKSLIRYHRFKEDFWNMVLQSSFHKASPRIYSFELKVIAS